MNAESIYNLTMLMNNYALFQSVIQKGCSEDDIKSAMESVTAEPKHYEIRAISGLLTQKDAGGAYYPDVEMIKSLITGLLHDWFPELTIVPISEYENLSRGKTYKDLYEDLKGQQRSLDEEIYNATTSIVEKDHEIAYLGTELKLLKEKSKSFQSSSDALLSFISNLLNGEITVRVDTDPHDKLRDHFEQDVSTRPGVYDGKRPSWFTELSDELNKLNESRKNARESVGSLKSLLHFWKGMEKKKDEPVEKRAEEVDEKRKEKVLEILKSADNNEVKYLKYMLITPGIPSEYMKTLNGCADMGIDADVIIQLLERPVESFNREIIEAYVSRAHKGVAYDYKQKLAEELLMGNWYITATTNDKKTKYQLVPWEDILEVKNKLEEIAEILSTKSISDDASDYVSNVVDNHAEMQEKTTEERPNVEEVFAQYGGFNETFVDLLEQNDPSLSAAEKESY